MKWLLVSVLMFSFSAFADHHEEKLEEVKSKLISHLDQRITHLQATKSCVSSANDKDALKACKKKMKEGGKEMREAWKKKREERKAQKKS